ncbi:MAG TPA: UDP-N-acetylmuramate dehydrogenase [Acidimicrobiia bacterium]|nr:UDP-N-acetylmuramate dehydrogenase [Acidimicrobiia bacterium]
MTAATLDTVADALAVALPGRVQRDVPSAEHTTYRCGGPLRVLVRADDEADVVALARVLRDHPDVATLVVGRGSNLLVADDGFPGVAIVLGGALDELALDTVHSRVAAGGAVAVPVLARRAGAAGIAGLEFFVGIPGSVGGAVRMNAGGHGRETRDVLRSARVVDLSDGEVSDWDVDALALGYRRSALTGHHVVVRADFDGHPDEPEACERRISAIVRWRREHQPGGANAGSVFTNPPGDAAGRLIEAAGLKGLRIGGVTVSAKHANFFVADSGARAADVRALVAEVRRRVAEHSGVVLHPELHMVGFATEDGS